MRRRRFLQAAAGVAVSALAGQRVAARAKDRILIVGGGILGAAMAYHISRRGAQVTLLEKSAPAAGATGKSFAWINANFSKQPRHYHLLSRLGVQAFRDLYQSAGAALHAQWGGTLEWYTDRSRAEELQGMVRQQQGWGYPIRLAGESEFAHLAPHVLPGENAVAAFSELEGSVDAAQATRWLLQQAQAAGAQVVHPCEVVGIKAGTSSGVRLQTAQGEFRGEQAVIAGGVATPHLSAQVGAEVPLVPSPSIVVRTAPHAALIERVLVSQEAHFHQQVDGRLVIGDDYGPPDTEAHRALASTPQDFPDASFAQLHGQRILAQAARSLPALAEARLERVDLCWRPLPKDGFPIVGSVPSAPQVYVAVTHSGVTLGPLLGELVALELLDGVQVDLLAPYRPARFAA